MLGLGENKILLLRDSEIHVKFWKNEAAIAYLF